MSVLRPRNRIVYFRVSEDEFDEVSRACQATGARSISELARSAMIHMIETPQQNPRNHLFDKLTVLENMVASLNDRVHQLTMILSRDNPTTNGHGSASESEDRCQDSKWSGE